LGQMPPAYTQIDCSYESFDSNSALIIYLINDI
jgi:hypothetical protein